MALVSVERLWDCVRHLWSGRIECEDLPDSLQSPDARAVKGMESGSIAKAPGFESLFGQYFFFKLVLQVYICIWYVVFYFILFNNNVRCYGLYFSRGVNV